MTLDYLTYRDISELQKLENLFQIDISLLEVDAKQAKHFLGILLNDKRESSYCRKKSFEIIARLTLLDRIAIEGTIDKLLDIEHQDDHFIILQAIKFSHHFYNTSPGRISEWLAGYSLHADAEIRSESFLALGRIHFLQGLACADRTELVSELLLSKRYLDRSSGEIENRVDATLFSRLCNFFLEVLNSKSDVLETLYQEAAADLKHFLFYSVNRKPLSVFLNLVDCISSIKKIATSQLDTWIDFRKEFNELFIELKKIEALSICDDYIIGSTVEQHIRSINEHLLGNVLIEKFQYEIKKLRTLYDDPFTSAEQKEVINNLIELIDQGSLSKKKDKYVSPELLVKLCNSFPSIPIEKIKADLSHSDNDDVSAITEIFIKYLMAARSTNPISSTGFTQGDEIADSISREIDRLLPSFSIEKFTEFGHVLRDVINYFINCVRGEKARFSFLFKPNALELELQQSMLTFLRAGPRAGYYLSEVKEFADGGRVDIVYNSPLMQLPIELKRDFDALTWEEVLNKYVAQAQSYAYSRDAISFLLLLDLSPQKPNRPEADVRNLFRVLSLPSRQVVGGNNSNYVITFIIPGNKISPSERSKSGG
jgi:hypothetical protein